MVNRLFTDSNYVGLKKMMDATVMRQEAIASNLANLETPNYKRIDVEGSFGHQLEKAMASGNVRNIQKVQPRMAVDKTAAAANRDGNTVQLETELLNLQQNTMNHQLQTQFLTTSLARLKTAISGRTS